MRGFPTANIFSHTHFSVICCNYTEADVIGLGPLKCHMTKKNLQEHVVFMKQPPRSAYIPWPSAFGLPLKVS